MPTDYTTTNTTPSAPSAPDLVGLPWFQRPVTDWSSEMEGGPTPETPVADGSAPRPTFGLVFPR